MTTGASVLVIDNYDSFTYNLVQYLGELGAELDVVRNDEAAVDELLERGHERLIVSPGPCTPAEAGISTEAIERFAQHGTPVLGVCLGHQALAAAFGGEVVRGEPVHGKTAQVEHDGRTIFSGLDSPFVAGRYHSLVVEPSTLPDELEVSARSRQTVMGLRHRELPAEGVQFHPESILTADGKTLLRNFLTPRDDPISLFQGLIDVWNSGDFQRIADIYLDDAVMVPVPEWPEPDPLQGRAEIVEFWSGVAPMFDGGLTGELETVRELPDSRIVSSFRWQQPGAASGAESEILVWGLTTLRDGLIARQEFFTDEASALAATGK